MASRNANAPTPSFGAASPSPFEQTNHVEQNLMPASAFVDPYLHSYDQLIDPAMTAYEPGPTTPFLGAETFSPFQLANHPEQSLTTGHGYGNPYNLVGDELVEPAMGAYDPSMTPFLGAEPVAPFQPAYLEGHIPLSGGTLPGSHSLGWNCLDEASMIAYGMNDSAASQAVAPFRSTSDRPQEPWIADNTLGMQALQPGQ